MAKQGAPQLPRGRPREFDADTVIGRVMDVFWSRGYHVTSLPDLLAATKLSRGSLYAAFGDKHALFLLALDRYIDEALLRFDAELHPRRDAMAALRLSLAGYVDRTSGVAGQRGCLVVATAMELAAADGEVRARIRRLFSEAETRLTGALIRANEAGALAEGVEPAVAAHMLLCFVEGMRVVGKTSPHRSRSQAMADMLIDRLIA